MNLKLFFKWIAISVAGFLALIFALGLIVTALVDVGSESRMRAAEEVAAGEPEFAPAPVVAPAAAAVREGAAKVEAERLVPGALYRTNDGYLAAVTREKLDRALRIVDTGDRAALKQLLASDSEVILLKSDLEVYLTETGSLATLVKIRLKGSIAEVWTVREAILR